MNEFNWNPAVMVPLGAFSVAIVAIVSGAVSSAHSRRIKAEERMAMIARGVPLAEIESYMSGGTEVVEKLPTGPTVRMGNSRRAGMTLLSVGIGLGLFGAALAFIVRDRDVMVVAASGLIPLAIGVGFLIDYSLQRRDVERYQAELGDGRPLR